jgi:hypothetical protein
MHLPPGYAELRQAGRLSRINNSAEQVFSGNLRAFDPRFLREKKDDKTFQQPLITLVIL